jgi:hypothetical protein
LSSLRKGGTIRGRTRYRAMDSRRFGGGEEGGREGLLGGEVTGSKRRARVSIRRGSLITRGDERKEFGNEGRRKQRRRQRVKLTTENNLLKETDHGDESFSGEDINTEDEKEKVEKGDIYIGQGSNVNEDKEDRISNTDVAETMADPSKNVNAKHATSKSMMELLDKKELDIPFITLENFDKKTMKELLEKKEKKVGDLVLVDGLPAVIRKRISEMVRDVEMNTIRKIKVKNLKLIKTRPFSLRRAKTARRRVRVKVRAGQGISVEDIEDQLNVKKADDNTKHSLYNRPFRVNRERKTFTSNEYRA